MKRVFVLGAALAGTLALAAPAEAKINCAVVDGGPAGPAGDLLRVKASAVEIDVAAVVREGNALRVTDDRLGKAVECAGRAPTVSTIDLITFEGASNSALVLDLRDGPLAPGATPEADGASEIEVDVVFPDSGSVLINAPSSPTDYDLGTAGGEPVIDVDAFDGAASDVDISLGKTYSVIVRGGGGADALDARGGGLSNPFRRFVVFEGGPGDDVLAGATKASILLGGGGADRLVGMGGRDDLDGGGGRDVLVGAGGGDTITAADGTRDRIRCGPGLDRVEADRMDRLTGCEKVTRP